MTAIAGTWAFALVFVPIGISKRGNETATWCAMLWPQGAFAVPFLTPNLWVSLAVLLVYGAVGLVLLARMKKPPTSVGPTTDTDGQLR